MPEKKSFYITTTLPYVNAEPHIGFALELVQSDAVARYKRLIGKDVFFSTGTDEYGQKIFEAAEKEGKDVKEYVDEYAHKYLNLKDKLNLSFDNFIRTTSKENIAAAEEFWQLCDKKGDIYKKLYKGLYCVGCEKFLTEKDLVDGKCILHPNLTPETVEEENYFFKLSNYKEKILSYLSDERVVIPDWRRKEAIDYARSAMDDFSISRSIERVSWGIPVPGDDTQVMYVWFGAFVNYISTLGWPIDKENFEKFWENGEVVQTAGKDMVKFQSVMWQGMLMSAGIKNTDTVFYHGFINSGGQRMSKSLGNVISPNELVEKYGTDAARYLLLRHVHSTEDTDVTWEKLDEWYNAHLANGLGNLASRILTLSEKYLEKCPEIPEKSDFAEYFEFYEKFEINQAVDYVWNKIGELDKDIQEKKPWESKDQEVINGLVLKLYVIARMLSPIMPETNEKLKKLIRENKKPGNLFPRLNA